MTRRADHDRPKLYVIRRPGGLVPATLFDDDEIARYAMGARLVMTLYQARNESLLRLYWSVLGKVGQAIGKDKESIHWHLRMQAGLHREIYLLDDSHTVIPKSLTELDQAGLKNYVDTAFDIISTRIVPGVTVDELLGPRREYIGGEG